MPRLVSEDWQGEIPTLWICEVLQILLKALLIELSQIETHSSGPSFSGSQTGTSSSRLVLTTLQHIRSSQNGRKGEIALFART